MSSDVLISSSDTSLAPLSPLECFRDRKRQAVHLSTTFLHDPPKPSITQFALVHELPANDYGRRFHQNTAPSPVFVPRDIFFF